MLAADASVATAEVTSPSIAPIGPASLAAHALTHQSSSTEASFNQPLVFVDASLSDLDTLLADTPSEASIVLLNPDEDFEAQLTAEITRRHGIRSIHLITHGNAGEILLGDQRLDVQSLLQKKDSIGRWSRSLHPDADILVYGCRTGLGAAGLEWMQTLKHLTGADVAASDDLTGSMDRDGDWELERQVGQIQSSLIVSSAAKARYSDVLDVVINARGEEGGETFQLIVDEQVVSNWTATTQQQSFRFETDQPLSAQSIRVAFTNDLYQPQRGIDRNLVVDNIEIDGVTFETESSDTYSNGTWMNEDRLQPGFGRGDTLHANGFFQFGGVAAEDQIIFDDQAWRNDNAAASVSVSTESGDLIVGSDTTTSIWRFAEIESGQTYRFRADTVLDAEVSGLSNYVIGVNMYDDGGNLIRQVSRPVSAFGSSEIKSDFVAPDNVSYSTVWIHAFPRSTFEPNLEHLIVKDITLEQIEPNNDTTPPGAFINFDQLDVNDQQSTGVFRVNYFDDVPVFGRGNTPVQVGDSPGFTLTDPNGNSVPLSRSFVVSNGIPTEAIEQLTFPRPADGFVPGEYTLAMNDNYLSDLAGNFAPGGIIGTFDLTVSGLPNNPNDLNPPTIELTDVITSPNNSGFRLLVTDDQSPVTIAPGRNIRVTDPNGNEVPAFGINGGSTEIPNQSFEAYSLLLSDTPAIGEYRVTALRGYATDQSNNVTPEQLVGVFQIIA